MYLSFYKLRGKPFQISADPKFLWLGEKHKEALYALRYGILDNKGFVVLTGDVGTGKTTLINALLNSLGEDTRVATISNPDMEKPEFYRWILNRYGITQEISGKASFLVHFEKFLMKANDERKKVLLIIDESQHLNAVLLEEIRLLSNIELKDKKLINIFFVGQNEFKDLLVRPENRALRHRIAIFYHIQNFTRDETSKYIRHRLRVAGSERGLFTVNAVDEIFAYSTGNPRKINMICDHSLLLGYIKDADRITSSMVRECYGILNLETETAGMNSPSFDQPAEQEEFVDPGQTINLPPDREDNKPAGSLKSWAMMFVSIFLLFFMMALIVGQYENLAALKDFNFSTGKKYFNDILPRDVVYYSFSSPISLALPGAFPSVKKMFAVPNAVSPKPFQPDIVEVDMENVYANERKTDDFTKSPVPARIGPEFSLTVYFGINSFDLSVDAQRKLDQLIPRLLQNLRESVLVRGYTDSFGNYQNNRRLSEERANQVKEYLVAHQIAWERIEAIGIGPVQDRATRYEARRAEIELKGK